MDTFNVICGIITIASFLFAIVIYLRDRSLRQHLQANLLSLIHGLDRISAMDDHSQFEKSHMAVSAANLRDQTIGILRTFSTIDHRLPTYEFGLESKSAQEREAERKERLGFGNGGCIAAGQNIALSKGKSTTVESLKAGDELIGWNHQRNESAIATVTAINSHNVSEVICINDELVLSASQGVFEHSRGYVPATDLQLGNQVYKFDGELIPIRSLVHKCEPSVVYAVSTTSENLFCSGVLLHNKTKK